ncbi:MAG: phospho-sugar mutase [Chlamydiota bacterium]
MKNNLPDFEDFSSAAKRNLEQVFTDSYDSSYRKDTLLFVKKYPEQVEDAFGHNLKFGTGGIRALMGVGTNRLNEYTVEKITQGLASYLCKTVDKPSLSVFVSYDNRTNSLFFAKLCAKVLAGNGVSVYITKNLRPTPLCSFGCRHYGCSAAIMITASHNPPEYNGYKVYWADGGQVTPPHDLGIVEEVAKIEGPEEVQREDLKSSLIHWVEQELDEAYFAKAQALFIRLFGKRRRKSRLSIVYSNLHGTGITTIPRVLGDVGFSQISYVKGQLSTDGEFPEAKNPNPENANSLEPGIQLMQEKEADLFLATDPDADRVGVVAMHNETPIYFSGNQIACICLDFLLHHKKFFPEKGAFIKSVVTTDLFSAMCRAHGYPCYEVPTGFKYIAEKIAKWEQTSEHNFLFGAEESLGYLLGDFVRDKDAALASGLIALATEYAKKQKLSLYDLLKKIYASYGVYREHLFSIPFPVEKRETMQGMVTALRCAPKSSFATFRTKRVEDYEQGLVLDLATDLTSPLPFPKSTMVRYLLEKSSSEVPCSFALRLSGTEPKIKCYLSCHRKEFSSVDSAIADCDQDLEALEALLRKELHQG